jgi:hypothetical protein
VELPHRLAAVARRCAGRDALRELGRVINTSLDPRTVLQLARRAIGSLEGHRASFIGPPRRRRRDLGAVRRPAEAARRPEYESEPERRVRRRQRCNAHLLAERAATSRSPGDPRARPRVVPRGPRKLLGVLF